MNRKKTGFMLVAVIGLAGLAFEAFHGSLVSSARMAHASLPPAVFLPSDKAVNEQAIRFLENKIKNDPEEFIAENKLAHYYMQRVRETGDLAFLNLAARAAHASLATMPAERNFDALTNLTQVEFASHEFVSSRDHAKHLASMESDKGYPQQFLGDALLELGDYDGATAAFQRMEFLGGVNALTRSAMEQRKARLASLHGDTEAAQHSLEKALVLALSVPFPPRETVAWCRWQLGETAFSIGDYAAAERHYRDALTTFPDYFRALASLGRVLAARGDLPGAIKQYERAVYILPDPSFVAALGDLYALAGRDKDAAAQYQLVEAIAKLSDASGILYNRLQALFYADHDSKPQEAYENAVQEFAVRQDIYGADAVAWTALKAGKLSEAQTAMHEALRLGTKDARLFYHAGMIAQASGDQTSARDYLERALMLSPQFDPLQAPIARKALANAKKGHTHDVQ